MTDDRIMPNYDIGKVAQQWEFDGISKTPYAGVKSLKWLSTDNKRRYEKNKPEAWSEDSVMYEFNRHGFRTNEFEKSNKFTIACFGCSLTIGIGVPNHYTWPEVFCKKFTQKTGTQSTVFNFGWSGTSADFACRTLFSMVDILEPDLILFLAPAMTRFEYYNSKGTAIACHPTKSQFELYYKTILNDHTSKNNFLKNITFIQSIAELHSIPWLFSTWDHDISLMMSDHPRYVGLTIRDQTEWARDMQHPSLKTYTNVADMFMEKYNNE